MRYSCYFPKAGWPNPVCYRRIGELATGFEEARYVLAGVRTRDWRSSYNVYRANLGRGILLGLELLVGADIMSTVTAPLTFVSVGLLAGAIFIRTFLSFSLETEIEGCWPWKRAEIERKSGMPEPPGTR